MEIGERYIYLVSKGGYVIQTDDIVGHLLGIGPELAKNLSVVTMQVIQTKPASTYVGGEDASREFEQPETD